MAKLRKELSDKALAVLTPEQREQFDKMKGEKFDFPRVAEVDSVLERDILFFETRHLPAG